MKIVCVHYGEKYKTEYVNILNNMVKRHSDCELLCISDHWEGKDCEVVMGEKDMGTWWNKLQLFKPGFLKGERFLYLDLDVVISGNINHLLEYEGDFVTIKDWIFDTYNSSAMLMTGGAFPHVYGLFVKDMDKMKAAFPQGDQQLISTYIEADNLFSREDVTSFRMDRCEGAPKSPLTIFHGRPNPDEVKDTWVAENWR